MIFWLKKEISYYFYLVSNLIQMHTFRIEIRSIPCILKLSNLEILRLINMLRNKHVS